MKKNSYIKRILRATAMVACLALSVSFVACGTTAGDDDIITLKETSNKKTQISVLVKYAFSINEFEKIVEAKFPEIDLVQVGNYTRDMGINEYYARLEHDDLTDIVMTWPLDVGKEFLEDRLLDLSGMEFSSKYNISMLNETAVDGKLYYLPGPAQVRGILYNKTLFKENGWEIPTSFEEFLKLCNTIEKTGIRALQLGFENQEVFDTAFVGYNFGNYYSRPKDIQWIDSYNQGTGSFGDHFSGALDVFSQMIDAKVFKPSDLDINYSERESLFFSRQCAMIEDSALMARLGFEQTGTTDEFAIMPFFNPGTSNDWARLYMVCYIGLNKHLAEPANKEKYQLVMQLMDYISTVEGQKALSADTGAMFSSLTDAAPPDISEIEMLLPALNEGRSAIFPTLKNAQSALRDGLAGMLDGSLTKQDVIKMVDAQNLTPLAVAEPLLLGHAEKDFTLIQTGSFVADALRTWADSEIALFLDNGKDGKYNGKGISGRIYAGDITSADLQRIMPDLKAGDNGAMWKAEISGENLLKVLENSISIENNQASWFYYFSGLKISFCPTAPSGERIKSAALADGSKIQADKIYSIAITEGSVPQEYLQNCAKTDVLSFDIISGAIKAAGKISPSEDGRFTVIKK